MVQILPSNSSTADDIIRSLCNREGDITGINFMKYKGVALDVYRELNLTVIRHTKRVLIEVDKRTNSITIPHCDYLHWASISVIDECNKIRPMLINTNLTHDIVDISNPSEGCCEHQSCTSSLCSQIKSYELIQQVTNEAMPNGTTKSFTSTTRKRVDPDGKFYTERTFPVRTYNESNVWVGVELQTETEVLCHLDVDAHGCVCDTPKNREEVGCACSADTFEIEAGCWTKCNTVSPDTYNISEQGDRLVFPSNFAFDKVLLRYYVNPTGRTLLIPIIAKEAFIAGIKHYTVPHKRRPVLWEIQLWEKKWIKGKGYVKGIINRYSIAEWYSVLTPKIDMV